MKKILIILLLSVYAANAYTAPLSLEISLDLRGLDKPSYEKAVVPLLNEFLTWPETRISLYVNINSILEILNDEMPLFSIVSTHLKSGRLRIYFRPINIIGTEVESHLALAEENLAHELLLNLYPDLRLYPAPPGKNELSLPLSNPWSDLFVRTISGNDTDAILYDIKNKFIGAQGDTIHLNIPLDIENLMVLSSLDKESIKNMLEHLLQSIQDEPWIYYGFSEPAPKNEHWDIKADALSIFQSLLLKNSKIVSEFRKYQDKTSTRKSVSIERLQELFSLEYILSLEKYVYKSTLPNKEMKFLNAILQAQEFQQLSPDESEVLLKDIDGDSEPEFLFVNSVHFLAFSHTGDRLLYWFDLKNGIFVGGWLTEDIYIDNVFVGHLDNARFEKTFNKNIFDFKISLGNISLVKRIKFDMEKVYLEYRVQNLSNASHSIDIRMNNSFSPDPRSILKGNTKSFYYYSKNYFEKSIGLQSLGVYNSKTLYNLKFSFLTPPDGVQGIIGSNDISFNPNYHIDIPKGESIKLGMILEPNFIPDELKRLGSADDKRFDGLPFPISRTSVSYPWVWSSNNALLQYPIILNDSPNSPAPRQLFIADNNAGVLFQLNLHDIVNFSDTKNLYEFLIPVRLSDNNPLTFFNLNEWGYNIKCPAGWDVLLKLSNDYARLVLSDGRWFDVDDGIRIRYYSRTLNAFIPHEYIPSLGDGWMIQCLINDTKRDKIVYAKPESETYIMKLEIIQKK